MDEFPSELQISFGKVFNMIFRSGSKEYKIDDTTGFIKLGLGGPYTIIANKEEDVDGSRLATKPFLAVKPE